MIVINVKNSSLFKDDSSKFAELRVKYQISPTADASNRHHVIRTGGTCCISRQSMYLA